MFSTIIIFDQNEQSADFAEWPILAIFKNVPFLEYWMFFKAIFFAQKSSKAILYTFLYFQSIQFWPKITIRKGYSLSVVAKFRYFQNAPIFRILGVWHF